ncbi:MAG: hypothetical protein BRD30_10455 [Bacteroidetes bacterium QH_2_63_10]|nr:MAG: hypothetical protein BRD30_10455 [Bacteroidetes bacterium QH_2_63_10]
MPRLRRRTHKTALALQARSPKRADFSLHEMEELSETIQSEVPTYEGHDIAAIPASMPVASVEALEGALAERARSAVESRLGELVHSYNQRHAATDRGFLKVGLEDGPNAYAQDVTPGGN